MPSLNNFLSCQEPIHTLGEGKKLIVVIKDHTYVDGFDAKKWNQTSHLSTQDEKTHSFTFNILYTPFPLLGALP